MRGQQREKRHRQEKIRAKSTSGRETSMTAVMVGDEENHPVEPGIVTGDTRTFEGRVVDFH